jgi:hypothetical protein
VLLSAFAVHAVWHRPWRSGPQLQKVFDLHFSENDSKIKWRAANTFWHDYNHNTTHEKRKARALHWALGLFIGQTLLLVIALVLVAHDQRSDTTPRSECPARAAHGEQAALLQVAAPQRARRADSALARPRSSRKSLTTYAASGTARTRACKRVANEIG